MTETLNLSAEQSTGQYETTQDQVVPGQQPQEGLQNFDQSATETYAPDFASESEQAESVLTPRSGLEVTIKDEAVKTEVFHQLTAFREFIGGDRSKAGEISETGEAESPSEAISLLSDLGKLFVTDNDLKAIGESLVEQGEGEAEVIEKLDELSRELDQDVADILGHSIRGEDLFGHGMYKNNTSELLPLILRSGALKNKRGVYQALEEGEYVGTGEHSMMLHLRQNATRETFYFPAESVVDAAPYISPGIDDYSSDSEASVRAFEGSQNRIRGGEEARHGVGSTKHAFGEVEIEATDEFIASLPEASPRENRDDVSIMHSVDSPEQAADYELSLEDATIFLTPGGLAAGLAAEKEPTGDLKQEWIEKYLLDSETITRLNLDREPVEETRKRPSSLKIETCVVKVRQLSKHNLDDMSPELEELGIQADDLPVFKALLSEAYKVQAEYEDFATHEGMSTPGGAIATALSRLIARELGADEAVAKNIFFLSERRRSANDADGDTQYRFAQYRNRDQQGKHFVGYKDSKLGFSQQELARYCLERPAA